MGLPPRRPEPEPSRSSTWKTLLVAAAVAIGGIALLLLVGFGLLVATCAGMK